METQYDFDDIVNRRNTNCGRWDTMDKKYGTRDMIHLGVADMDFRAPVEIRDSLHKILDMGVLGGSRGGGWLPVLPGGGLCRRCSCGDGGGCW